MITKSQQRWLDHLSDKDKITIKPFDPTSSQVFMRVKRQIVEILGNIKVLHRGASYLKISGQDEIDIYVPVLPKNFDTAVKKLTKAFGKPASLYPLIRARFRLKNYKKHVDVFVINKNDKGWVDSEIFTNHLLGHADVLDEYKNLKEKGNGLSTREYYTKKIEFINRVLKTVKPEK